MSVWDVATWAAVVILGPGAVIVFVAFLRDLRRLLAAPPERPVGQRPPSRSGDGSRGA